MAPHPVATRFRARAFEVEAVTWLGPTHKLPGVVFEHSAEGDPSVAGGERVVFYVKNLHDQPVCIAPGDVIVTEPDGVRHAVMDGRTFADRFAPASQPGDI